MMLVPQWLLDELALGHRGIEIRWMDYGPRKVFVLPVTGDAFYRMPATKRLGGAILYRRYLTEASPPKWRLHPQTYLPDAEHVTDARFVVFQTYVGREDVVKLFDCVNDDGTLHPLDRRILDGINIRDGKHGAHEKAIADVESAPLRAEMAINKALVEIADEPLSFIYRDIARHATGGANDQPDPLENLIEIVN